MRMLKKSNIVVLFFLFVWGCSIPRANIETVSDSTEIKLEKIPQEQVQDLSGIQFFMDGMMFMEQLPFHLDVHIAFHQRLDFQFEYNRLLLQSSAWPLNT